MVGELLIREYGSERTSSPSIKLCTSLIEEHAKPNAERSHYRMASLGIGLSAKNSRTDNHRKITREV